MKQMIQVASTLITSSLRASHFPSVLGRSATQRSHRPTCLVTTTVWKRPLLICWLQYLSDQKVLLAFNQQHSLSRIPKKPQLTERYNWTAAHLLWTKQHFAVRTFQNCFWWNGQQHVTEVIINSMADQLNFEKHWTLYIDYNLPTWNEHISVSSTLIIAPALSNSPQ